MKVLPRHGQEENLNLQEDKAVKACNSLRGGHLPASHIGKAGASPIFQALDRFGPKACNVPLPDCELVSFARWSIPASAGAD